MTDVRVALSLQDTFRHQLLAPFAAILKIILITWQGSIEWEQKDQFYNFLPYKSQRLEWANCRVIWAKGYESKLCSWGTVNRNVSFYSSYTSLEKGSTFFLAEL